MKAPLLKRPLVAAPADACTPVPGQSWGYAYDAIGNRTASTRGQPGESDTGGVHTTSYAASSLNQYSSITRPNAVEITGVTFADVPTVKVNGQPATGRPPGNGEPGGFAQWLEGIAGDSLPNGQWPEVTLEFKKPAAGMQGHDLQHTRTGHVYVRPSETPLYDDDGNLIQDAGWTYTWDAENRLIAAEMRDVSVPASVDLRRVEFSYDAKGRSFERRLKVKATPTGSTVRNTAWQEVSHVHYWYDGWNLAAETDDSGSVHQYIWGTDLSGTPQGAGGVGGLLGVATAGHMYAVCTEVNGNVMGLVDGQTGQLVARWDYDPFGNLVTDWYAPGVTSGTCPIRFSSKALDPDLGWYYYGYRYYEPESGRWPSRDPIAERGGLNLYGMCGNDPVNLVDLLGEAITFSFDGNGWGTWNKDYVEQRGAAMPAEIGKAQNRIDEWIKAAKVLCDSCPYKKELVRQLESINKVIDGVRSDVNGGTTLHLRLGDLGDDVFGSRVTNSITGNWHIVVNYHHGETDFFKNPHEAEKTFFHELTHAHGTVDSGDDYNNAHSLEALLDSNSGSLSSAIRNVLGRKLGKQSCEDSGLWPHNGHANNH